MSEPGANLVLIHGAWAASWVWAELRPLLERQGVKTLALDLPGTAANPANTDELSLEACVRYVEQRCAELSGPLFLVGHSGGGVIATQVAEQLHMRLSGVIYIAGMMLPSGLGFAQLCADLSPCEPTASGIGPFLQWNAEHSASRVPPAAACRIFLHDLPVAQARVLAERLDWQPEATRSLVAQWTADRFGRLPRLYVEARQDRSVVLAAQRRMQALVPGAEVASLDCGHVPQASAPSALAEALIPFVQRHRQSAGGH